MPLYELSISVSSRPATPNGPSRQEGDIINVQKHPAKWGLVPSQNRLIVIVDSPATWDEMIRYKIPWYDDLRLTPPMQDFEVVDGELVALPYTEPTMIAKRRFSMPLELIRDSWITDLDIDKVKRTHVSYQPMKKKQSLLDEGISVAEVDVVSSWADDNTEYKINMAEKVSIIYDKAKGSYKYLAKRKP